MKRAGLNVVIDVISKKLIVLGRVTSQFISQYNTLGKLPSIRSFRIGLFLN
jgi:hypothetical protein